MQCIASARFVRTTGPKAGRPAMIPVVVDVEVVPAREAPVVGRMINQDKAFGYSDFRSHDGKLWHPVDRGPYGAMKQGRLIEAKTGFDLRDRRSEIVHRRDNALETVARGKVPGATDFLVESEDPAAEAAVKAARDLAANTISILGIPWRRSPGPMMMLPCWRREWNHVNFVNPAMNEGEPKPTVGMVRYDRWNEALDLFAEWSGERPEGQGEHGVSIHEPSAFENLFDDQSNALEAFCWFYLSCFSRKDLAAQGPREVVAAVDMREALQRRYPERGLFPMPIMSVDCWPHAPVDLFSIADASELAPRLEALLACDEDRLRRDTRAHDVVQLWNHFSEREANAELVAMAF